MFSPLRVLTLMLALVLGGQIVIAANEPAEEIRRHNARSDGPGGGPYLKAKINFVAEDRLAVYNYYHAAARSGPCPVGLLRGEEGCISIAVKKWSLGRALPRDVVFRNLPADLASQLAPPPPGYRYVRAGGDVLLISRGIGIVVTAIEDLARL
jgi:hypothetical protein